MTDSPTATLAAAQDVVAVTDLALSRDLLADEVLLLDALLDELDELVLVELREAAVGPASLF